MKNPPDGVKLVMAAICVMKDIRPDKVNDPAGTGKKVESTGAHTQWDLSHSKLCSEVHHVPSVPSNRW